MATWVGLGWVGLGVHRLDDVLASSLPKKAIVERKKHTTTVCLYLVLVLVISVCSGAKAKQSKMNNEKISDVKHQLKAIAGSVAVITADINTLTAEMQTVQLEPCANCDAKREEHVNNTTHIVGEESPDKSLIHKTTLHGGSKDKCRPVINGLIPSINCLADAMKSNRDQDYADRLFSEVMKTEGFHEDSLVNIFDHLNEHPVLARVFITLRPHLQKEFCIKLASKLLVTGSTLAAFTPTTKIYDRISLQFVDSKLQSMSSMPVYRKKSHEELRWEDYQIEKNQFCGL